MAKKIKEHKEIPTGKIKRSSLIGATTAWAGLKKIKSISKKPFLSPEKRRLHDEKDNKEIAAVIFKTLGRLRGTALKAAQMMAMESELVPEAYRKELSKANSEAPPINRALIRKIISTELGAPPEDVFHSFESVPFAAASIGQVHRAVSRKKLNIALKVQYPGLAESIKSDITMMKMALKPTKYSAIFRYCFKEIEEKINEELDYHKEARNSIHFYNNLKMENIVVPEVITELSTKRILATQMSEGVHLDEWLKSNPSQDKKNQFGQLFMDLYNRTLYGMNLIHADPNPGNYLLRKDGKLGLIDFGCVKKLPREFTEGLRKLSSSYLDMNGTEIKDLYKNLGIHFKERHKNDSFNNFIFTWIEWITRPYQSEYFDFSENKDYFNEGLPYIKKFYQQINFFDGTFTYFGRSQYGLYRILQKLGARVRCNFDKI